MDYEIRFFLDDFATLERMGEQLVMTAAVGDKGRWLWHFRKGLHGMAARVFAVGQHVNAVHMWEKRPRSMFAQWLENEYHISVSNVLQEIDRPDNEYALKASPAELENSFVAKASVQPDIVVA